MEYDALEIRVQPARRGEFYVHATAPTGAASGTLELPFDERDFKLFVLSVGRPRRGIRRLDSPEMGTAKEFGSRLFDALFQADVRDLYQTASAQADAAGKGLRITLILNQAPELMSVPWEYLCDDGRFLSVSERTPIVRFLELKKAHEPLAIESPLRILGMVSSPSDVVELDVDDERQRLEAALRPLTHQGLVEIVWLETATLSALLEAIQRGDFHVFHYIGHGAFDETVGDGVLLLEDSRGRGKPVTGDYLGQLLNDERTLQLAVLNACEGARTDPTDPFAGVAASLVKYEIPSVVAMQFEITDDAAILFAGGFYAALARGSPVDAAIASARKAIWADYNDIEWGTPVLFMRVPDGRVFDVHIEDAEGRDLVSDFHLEVDFTVEPPIFNRGDEVIWRLTIGNRGSTIISELSALLDDGTQLDTGSELQPGRKTVASWRSTPESDLESTVTISAVDTKGDRVLEQVKAYATLQSTAAEKAPTPGPGLSEFRPTDDEQRDQLRQQAPAPAPEDGESRERQSGERAKNPSTTKKPATKRRPKPFQHFGERLESRPLARFQTNDAANLMDTLRAREKVLALAAARTAESKEEFALGLLAVTNQRLIFLHGKTKICVETKQILDANRIGNRFSTWNVGPKIEVKLKGGGKPLVIERINPPERTDEILALIIERSIAKHAVEESDRL